ncbi:hypothetical protein J6590_012923 [Homalodisca vitripennis]|nr:hypothetical protein J6590_012923 [Homalodisca vitripennis]
MQQRRFDEGSNREGEVLKEFNKHAISGDERAQFRLIEVLPVEEGSGRARNNGLRVENSIVDTWETGGFVGGVAENWQSPSFIPDPCPCPCGQLPVNTRLSEGLHLRSII